MPAAAVSLRGLTKPATALHVRALIVAALLAVAPLRATAQDGAASAPDACHRALAARIKTCADECIAKAKAAVDPEIRDRILGYGCQTNCAKLEMFNGHACPR